MTDYPLALGLTVIVECAILLAWMRGRPPADRMLLVGAVAGINLVSHPLAWTALAASRFPPVATFVGVECAVVIMEAIALRCLPGVTWRRAFAIAIAMNAGSALLGLLVV